ncbi:MAG: glycosyltransferase family 4 protein [Gemmataceae bacterium]
MKLLFLNRSYWPDVEATGQLLTELCGDLARKHEVAVIAGRPNFVTGPLTPRELHNGVDVTRVGNRRFSKKSFLGRVVGLVTYLIPATLAALCARRPDVVVVETDPPVLGVVGLILKWWHRAALVYYLQDLYPEVGLATGKLRPGPITWFLRAATQVGLKAADRIVVLGEDMRDRVLDRGIPRHKIAIVPNWADAKAIRPLATTPLRREWGLNGRFVVMYSGNLGLSQSLDNVLDAANSLRADPVEFVFVGEGAAKTGLQQRVGAEGLTNVRFKPYQPKERLGESLAVADLHLITLQSGLAGTIVPSKLYGILAAGRPYIAAVEPSSEVARVTARGHCGRTVVPDSAVAIVDAVRWCVDHRDELRQMGVNGRQLAETDFDRAHAVARFDRVLGEALDCRQQRSRA